eukprot:jgi/Chlat1/9206/Chrsp97S08472
MSACQLQQAHALRLAKLLTSPSAAFALQGIRESTDWLTKGEVGGAASVEDNTLEVLNLLVTAAQRSPFANVSHAAWLALAKIVSHLGQAQVLQLDTQVVKPTVERTAFHLASTCVSANSDDDAICVWGEFPVRGGPASTSGRHAYWAVDSHVRMAKQQGRSATAHLQGMLTCALAVGRKLHKEEGWRDIALAGFELPQLLARSPTELTNQNPKAEQSAHAAECCRIALELCNARMCVAHNEVMTNSGGSLDGRHLQGWREASSHAVGAHTLDSMLWLVRCAIHLRHWLRVLGAEGKTNACMETSSKVLWLAGIHVAFCKFDKCTLLLIESERLQSSEEPHVKRRRTSQEPASASELTYSQPAANPQPSCPADITLTALALSALLVSATGRERPTNVDSHVREKQLQTLAMVYRMLQHLLPTEQAKLEELLKHAAYAPSRTQLPASDGDARTAVAVFFEKQLDLVADASLTVLLLEMVTALTADVSSSKSAAHVASMWARSARRVHAYQLGEAQLTDPPLPESSMKKSRMKGTLLCKYFRAHRHSPYIVARALDQMGIVPAVNFAASCLLAVEELYKIESGGAVRRSSLRQSCWASLSTATAPAILDVLAMSALSRLHEVLPMSPPHEAVVSYLQLHAHVLQMVQLLEGMSPASFVRVGLRVLSLTLTAVTRKAAVRLSKPLLLELLPLLKYLALLLRELCKSLEERVGTKSYKVKATEAVHRLLKRLRKLAEAHKLPRVSAANMDTRTPVRAMARRAEDEECWLLDLSKAQPANELAVIKSHSRDAANILSSEDAEVFEPDDCGLTSDTSDDEDAFFIRPVHS